MGTKASSTTTPIFKSGRVCFRSEIAGVVRTQSPRERNRMTATRAPGARRSKTVLIWIAVRLFFDFGFVDQHHWDVVANGVNALALDALQAALIGLQLHSRLAQRTHQNVQQILANRHGSIHLSRVAPASACKLGSHRKRALPQTSVVALPRGRGSG